ncbi:MAG: hypothetical protein QXX95_05755 [Nitrososphaerales archaeon]
MGINIETYRNSGGKVAKYVKAFAMFGRWDKGSCVKAEGLF